MTHSLSERLLLYARQFEDPHAPQNITTALREAVGAISDLVSANDSMAYEIDRLKAEVQTWVNHTKTAVWSDSEECKFLTAEVERLRAGGCARDQGTTQFCAEAAALAAENERLRAALEKIGRMKVVPDDLMNRMTLVVATNIARAALETPEASAAENTDDR